MLYNIAGLTVEILFCESVANNEQLIPSFSPFEAGSDEGKDDIFFCLTVDDSMRPRCDDRERIGKFDTGNGETIVDRFSDGGYQYIIKDINGGECCLLQTSNDFSSCRCALKGNYNMRRFGLNNALMLIFAFAGSMRQTLLIHASLVRHREYGYAFTAKSGTGKSTQVSNWLKYIPDCDLMNDDNPIIRIIDGEAYVFGSPWSGKTPCYRNVKARLGAITKIERSSENWVEKLKPVEAFANLLPAFSTMKWDKRVFDSICDTVVKLIETTNIYALHCLPDRDSAIVCHKEISL